MIKDYKKSGGFMKKGFGSHQEAHRTTCDGCHAVCEVPFVPNGKKPVYCRNCYKDKATTTSFTGQPFPRSDAPAREGADVSDLKKQFSILNTKLDRLTVAIEEQTRVLSSTR